MNEKLFAENMERKAKRRLAARAAGSQNGVWFGLGMMGLVGWSVVVPTLLGAALGAWIDNGHGRNPSSTYSWTLMLLVIGLIVGCLNAWHWVADEQREMQKNLDDDDQ